MAQVEGLDLGTMAIIHVGGSRAHTHTHTHVKDAEEHTPNESRMQRQKSLHITE